MFNEDKGWNAVTGEELAGFLSQVGNVDGKHRTSADTTEVAWRSLPFYEQVVLIRLRDRTWLPENLQIFYLANQGQLTRLDGTSPPIHQTNADAPVRINDDNVLDYLRFFCFFVRGEDGPFLVEGSEIDDVATPIATEKLLGDLSATVASVDRDSLATTVEELGKAFAGTGPDLQKIIDTGNSFIETANDNFDVTTALIRDSNTVLRGQLATQTSLRTFADQLSKFSSSLAGSDKDLRKVIDSGSIAATQLRTFLEQNGVELSELLSNLVTTGRIVVRHLPAIKQMLVVYPYAVAAGQVVVGKSDNGHWDAHFGLILNPTSTPCTQGYLAKRRNPESQRSDDPPMPNVRCTEPITKSNPRGLQNLKRVAPGGTSYDIEAHYDPATGLTWDVPEGSSGAPGTVSSPTLGEDSWKWLYLQPMLRTSR